ncbi:MAG: hypothetical protein NDJ89_16450 [Oligoflexia bacterium]|nr:hypothetical protein [Oligoflexia bacterium]
MKTPLALLLSCAFLLSLHAPGARAATIIHSNDVLGELEPCGCRNNPQGGLARKANWLRKLGDDSLLQLDAGDLLFPTDTVPDLLAEQWKVQARFHLKALQQLKHDAVVPGEKDFALGFLAFEELRKKAKLRFLAANLSRKNGKKAFDGSAVFTRKTREGKPLRIAVLGLVGEALTWPPELRASSAIAAARREVPALRRKADLVVALTHQGFEKDRELAKAVPGIDLIVGGHTQSFLQKPVREGKTWIFQSSFRNQYIGAIPVPFDGKDYQLTSLDAGFDSPAESPNELDRTVLEFKSAVSEINTTKQASLEQGSAPAGGATRIQTFGACGQCHLKQFDFWRKTPHVKALASLIEKQQALNKECLECHSVGLGRPGGFGDVAQPGALAKTGEDESLQPLGPDELAALLKSLQSAENLDSSVKLRATDAIAYPMKEALSLIRKTWAPVQCENCHATGGAHPFGGAYSKNVETAACLKCHTVDKAPEWYTKSGQLDAEKVQAKRAQVSCPAGELAPPDEP